MKKKKNVGFSIGSPDCHIEGGEKEENDTEVNNEIRLSCGGSLRIDSAKLTRDAELLENSTTTTKIQFGDSALPNHVLLKFNSINKPAIYNYLLDISVKTQASTLVSDTGNTLDRNCCALVVPVSEDSCLHTSMDNVEIKFSLASCNDTGPRLKVSEILQQDIKLSPPILPGQASKTLSSPRFSPRRAMASSPGHWSSSQDELQLNKINRSPVLTSTTKMSSGTAASCCSGWSIMLEIKSNCRTGLIDILAKRLNSECTYIDDTNVKVGSSTPENVKMRDPENVDSHQLLAECEHFSVYEDISDSETPAACLPITELPRPNEIRSGRSVRNDRSFGNEDLISSVVGPLCQQFNSTTPAKLFDLDGTNSVHNNCNDYGAGISWPTNEKSVLPTHVLTDANSADHNYCTVNITKIPNGEKAGSHLTFIADHSSPYEYASDAEGVDLILTNHNELNDSVSSGNYDVINEDITSNMREIVEKETGRKGCVKNYGNEIENCEDVPVLPAQVGCISVSGNSKMSPTSSLKSVMDTFVGKRDFRSGFTVSLRKQQNVPKPFESSKLLSDITHCDISVPDQQTAVHKAAFAASEIVSTPVVVTYSLPAAGLTGSIKRQRSLESQDRGAKKKNAPLMEERDNKHCNDNDALLVSVNNVDQTDVSVNDGNVNATAADEVSIDWDFSEYSPRRSHRSSRAPTVQLPVKRDLDNSTNVTSPNSPTKCAGKKEHQAFSSSDIEIMPEFLTPVVSKLPVLLDASITVLDQVVLCDSAVTRDPALSAEKATMSIKTIQVPTDVRIVRETPLRSRPVMIALKKNGKPCPSTSSVIEQSTVVHNDSSIALLNTCSVSSSNIVVQNQLCAVALPQRKKRGRPPSKGSAACKTVIRNADIKENSTHKECGNNASSKSAIQKSLEIVEPYVINPAIFIRDSESIKAVENTVSDDTNSFAVLLPAFSTDLLTPVVSTETAQATKPAESMLTSLLEIKLPAWVNALLKNDKPILRLARISSAGHDETLKSGYTNNNVSTTNCTAQGAVVQKHMEKRINSISSTVLRQEDFITSVEKNRKGRSKTKGHMVNSCKNMSKKVLRDRNKSILRPTTTLDIEMQTSEVAEKSVTHKSSAENTGLTGIVNGFSDGTNTAEDSLTLNMSNSINNVNETSITKKRGRLPNRKTVCDVRSQNVEPEENSINASNEEIENASVLAEVHVNYSIRAETNSDDNEKTIMEKPELRSVSKRKSDACQQRRSSAAAVVQKTSRQLKLETRMSRPTQFLSQSPGGIYSAMPFLLLPASCIIPVECINGKLPDDIRSMSLLHNVNQTDCNFISQTIAAHTNTETSFNQVDMRIVSKIIPCEGVFRQVYQCTFCIFDAESVAAIRAHIVSSHKTLMFAIANMSRSSTNCHRSALSTLARVTFSFCRHCSYVAVNFLPLWIHFELYHGITGILSSTDEVNVASPDANATSLVGMDGLLESQLMSMDIRVCNRKPVYVCFNCAYWSANKIKVTNHIRHMHSDNVLTSNSFFVKLYELRPPSNYFVSRHSYPTTVANEIPTYKQLYIEPAYETHRSECFICTVCTFVVYDAALALTHHIHAHQRKKMLHVCMHDHCTRVVYSEREFEEHVVKEHGADDRRRSELQRFCSVTLLEPCDEAAVSKPGTYRECTIVNNRHELFQ